MVRPITVGHCLSKQNQPRVSTNPMRNCLDRAAMWSYGSNHVTGHVAVQVAIVACRESRQSIAFRRSPSGSPTTTTLPEEVLVALAIAIMPFSAARAAAPRAPPTAPPTTVTSGRNRLTCRIAQRYHGRQAARPRSSIQVSGMQPGRSSGMTAQPSRSARRRIVGIHICACESPTTTIDLELVVFPTRQILLELWGAGRVRNAALRQRVGLRLIPNFAH